MKKITNLVVLGLALSFNTALASESTSKQSASGSESSKSKSFELFGGIGGGYSAIGNTQVDGYHLNAVGLGSFYSDKMVYDIGGGYFKNRIEGNYSSLIHLKANTNAGYAEASARLKLGDSIQVGPIAQAFFGTDVSFGPFTDEANSAGFAGLEGVYQIDGKSLDTRIVLMGLTDVTLNKRQVYLATAGIQIGLPFGGQKEPVKIEEPVVISQAAPIVEPLKEIRITLDKELVHFGTASAKLSASSDKFIKALGEKLSSNADAFGRLEVFGHTDQRGTYSYNLKLSKNRAESVRNSLMSAGLHQEKLVQDGFSYGRLMDLRDTPDAWAKNRRVELIFSEVTDVARIKKIIDDLKAQSSL